MKEKLLKLAKTTFVVIIEFSKHCMYGLILTSCVLMGYILGSIIVGVVLPNYIYQSVLCLPLRTMLVPSSVKLAKRLNRPCSEWHDSIIEFIEQKIDNKLGTLKRNIRVNERQFSPYSDTLENFRRNVSTLSVDSRAIDSIRNQRYTLDDTSTIRTNSDIQIPTNKSRIHSTPGIYSDLTR